MNAFKALATLLLLAVALAAPTPADVDAALREGRREVALQLVGQARSEHLVSAKLDYLDAVARFRTGDLGGASQSLTRARNIDPTLAFANPADVQAIDRAVRRRTWAGVKTALGALLGAVLGTLLVRARERRRARTEQWERGLDAMRRRVRERERELELAAMDAELRRDTAFLCQLRECQRVLWTCAAEAERGRLDPERVAQEMLCDAPDLRLVVPLKRPVPRRASTSSGGAAPLRRREQPSEPATDPGSDLLTGVLIGQSLSSPTVTVAPEPTPAPAPEPQRSDVGSDWNDSSLSRSSTSSWSDSSLSSSSDSGSSSSSDTSSSSFSSDSGSNW